MVVSFLRHQQLLYKRFMDNRIYKNNIAWSLESTHFRYMNLYIATFQHRIDTPDSV